MKIGIDINNNRQLVLTEVFNSIVLMTEEGNQFAICMRDDTVEMTVIGGPDSKETNKWYRANMETREIYELIGLPTENITNPNGG